MLKVLKKLEKYDIICNRWKNVKKLKEAIIMKNKILKISTIILLIMAMTLTNFIFVGSSIISYTASALETNNKNIEFDAYFTNSILF